MTSPSRLRRTFVTLAVCTFAVFAALLVTLTTMLRSRLRGEVEHRQAQAMQAVAQLQIDSAEARMKKLGLPLSVEDVFDAVLESSRLGGVLAVQLFDVDGHLRNALPPIAKDGLTLDPQWRRPLTSADARYFPRGSLEQIVGETPDGAAERTPLLEIVAPLGPTRAPGSLGIARYWIDGRSIAAEFARMDGSLAQQAGIAFAGGALLVGLLLAWTYRRLARAQQQLIDQAADLASANQELDFAAKTGALGAISAHLIHGLNNPLAGLEGFVADAANDETARGDAQRAAMDTARRLRTMVNDVVSVLRDEAAGSAEHVVPIAECIAEIEARARPVLANAGVTLQVRGPATGTLKARTANLAGLVIVNLLANATEASPRGARLQMEVVAAEGIIEFVVADQGPGLPETVRTSLFRPVKSTKAGGGGMGLAISARLARHAGGELTLVRSDAAGTVFKLTVPAA